MARFSAPIYIFLLSHFTGVLSSLFVSCLNFKFFFNSENWGKFSPKNFFWPLQHLLNEICISFSKKFFLWFFPNWKMTFSLAPNLSNAQIVSSPLALVRKSPKTLGQTQSFLALSFLATCHPLTWQPFFHLVHRGWPVFLSFWGPELSLVGISAIVWPQFLCFLTAKMKPKRLANCAENAEFLP